ncbi:hypothetical protein [Streptomyces sp. NPDC007369]|uniref:hypothetical protein n=1 Tax=Streptomyces sp. NPDC007369 TaxID=3154589 RepID=UPI0033F03036
MSRKPTSHVPHGEGPGRHKGTEQHGWSPDVDATHTEENPSARKSFETPKGSGAGRSRSGGSAQPADTGTPVPSSTRRGEDAAKKGRQKGHHDLGPKGRSGRPSGGKDSSAYTGVDPDAGGDQLSKG